MGECLTHAKGLTPSNTFRAVAGVIWDFKNLDGYESGQASGIPFSVSLSELMLVRVVMTHAKELTACNTFGAAAGANLQNDRQVELFLAIVEGVDAKKDLYYTQLLS